MLIASAHDLKRWRDPTPVKATEKQAWQSHRRAVLHRPTRLEIGEYRDQRERRFERYRAKQLELNQIDPPGAAYLAGLRACESGGNYSTNTGNGFYGAYQFDLQTWGGVGGSGLPSDAAPPEQDYRAAVLWRQRGSAPWPVCG